MEAADTFKGCFGGGTPHRDVRYTSQKQNYGVFSAALWIKTVSTFRAHWSTARHTRAVLATKSVTLAVSSRRAFLEGMRRSYVTIADVRTSFCESCTDEGLLVSLDRVEVLLQFRVCASSTGLRIRHIHMTLSRARKVMGPLNDMLGGHRAS